jgi:flagellar L-ring protein precursor FlgH
MNIRLVTILLMCSVLVGCQSTVEKLKRVGKNPDLAQLDMPVDEDQPSPAEKEEMNRKHVRRTNSLWQPGGISFFRDNRAWRVGDILTVNVVITDSATLANSTTQTRKGSDSMGITNLFGKEKVIGKLLGKAAVPASLVDTNSARNQAGSGNITRKENINAAIAVLVRQVLPNGNLVIEGHQEVRVNSELREVKVAGIVRPRDITSANAINSNQIAEARISYGGRGVVSDMQTPRVGSQVIDIISPF